MKKWHIAVGGIALIMLLVLGDVQAFDSALTNDNENLDPNLKAFLLMLQWCEGTLKESNPYAVCYGYSHVIQDFSDHPAMTGEWTGEWLPDSYCYGAGINPPCKSTAAGAYQFNKPAWTDIKNKLGNIGFYPESQDYACIHKLDQMGALDFILTGNLEGAISKSNKYWASLPGSPYGQPTRTYAQCENFYLEQGGLLSETKMINGLPKSQGVNKSYMML